MRRHIDKNDPYKLPDDSELFKDPRKISNPPVSCSWCGGTLRVLGTRAGKESGTFNAAVACPDCDMVGS